MRPITDSELANRTDFELAILFQIASEALGRTNPDFSNQSVHRGSGSAITLL